jgi:hypothetical protein
MKRSLLRPLTRPVSSPLHLPVCSRRIELVSGHRLSARGGGYSRCSLIIFIATPCSAGEKAGPARACPGLVLSRKLMGAPFPSSTPHWVMRRDTQPALRLTASPEARIVARDG